MPKKYQMVVLFVKIIFINTSEVAKLKCQNRGPGFLIEKERNLVEHDCRGAVRKWGSPYVTIYDKIFLRHETCNKKDFVVFAVPEHLLVTSVIPNDNNAIYGLCRLSVPKMVKIGLFC